MKMKCFLTFAAILAIAMIVLPGEPRASAAEANDIAYSDMLDRLDQQGCRLADLEGQLARQRSRGRSSCHSPGITFMAEALFLKTVHSTAVSVPSDYQVAPRLTLGYVRSDGLGLRARWFDYSSRDPNTLISDVVINNIDLEVTDEIQLGCNWEGTIGLGVRLAEYIDDGDWGFPARGGVVNSVGPVLGVELNRRLNDRLSLFGLARQSIQFGDSVAIIDDETDQTYAISELQVGAEFRRPAGCGSAYWFVRGALEGQFYSSVAHWSGKSMGLVGGNVAFGLAR